MVPFHALRLAGLVIALASLTPAADAAYQITTVTRPGADSLSFWDINNAGLVVGEAANSDYSARTAFIYNSKTHVYTDLTGPAGATGSSALGISEVGTVVGEYTIAGQEAGSFHSFIYEAGIYSDFSLPGVSYLNLRGISADARYLTGIYTPDVDLGYHAFVFDRKSGTLTDLGLRSIVNGINSHGVVAGSRQTGDPAPFLYDVSTGVRTEYLPKRDRYRDVNDSGLITGYRFDDSGTYVALVGRPEDFSTLGVAGFRTFGMGINNAGTVVGMYDLDDGIEHAFIATSVPEPGVWALMLCGLSGLAVQRSRKARH